ncbi:MAG: hypothetical protein LBQ61_02300 [Spirochaetales bacterium]|jgi:hypothetical protein|nr:hypothetical protein [Spirochaetales bacterium]
MKKKPLILVLGLFLGTLSPGALEMRGLEIRMAAQNYLATEGVYTPSPWTTSLGGAALLGFKPGSPWELVPEVDVFAFAYRWYYGRAVPAALETAGRITALHFLVSPTLRFRLYSSSRFHAGLTLSPAVLLRVSLSREEDGKSLNGYFYREGRFFYPGAGLYFRWRYFETLGLSLSASAHVPIIGVLAEQQAYHRPPLWDQGVLSFRVGVFLPLGNPVP